MKRILFVQSKAPHGGLQGQEGLDAVLMGSAFAECTVLLLDDGIFQVLSGQDTGALGTKDYAVTYRALSDYGVDRIYCSRDHLEARGLSTGDLLVKVDPLSDDEVKALMAHHDVILNF
ncbi:MAG: sulfurtransferase complex subunit TusC [Pseudomonadales bacterium]